MLGKCLGCITDLVIDHTINISKYNLLAGSTYNKSIKPKKVWLIFKIVMIINALSGV